MKWQNIGRKILYLQANNYTSIHQLSLLTYIQLKMLYFQADTPMGIHPSSKHTSPTKRPLVRRVLYNLFVDPLHLFGVGVVYAL